MSPARERAEEVGRATGVRGERGRAGLDDDQRLGDRGVVDLAARGVEAHRRHVGAGGEPFAPHHGSTLCVVAQAMCAPAKASA